MPQRPEEIALERIKEAAESGAETLDLKELGLRSLPNELWELTNLKELHLQQNEFFDIPADIAKLVNLISLDISNSYASLVLNETRNKIARLPEELWRLPGLRKLDISFNDFDDIPAELWQKKDWELLGLGGLKLASLPPEIGHLQHLTQLSLSGNQLASLPPEIVQLQHLTQLDLSGNGLASLPPEVGQLQHLTSLNLSGNQLASLPKEIGQLQHLTSLDLSGNGLASLPPEIVQLQHLTHLYLSSNQLASLPKEIVQLQNLTQLDLSRNQLASLPPEIGQLQHLTSLDLSGNGLASLPPEIVQLQHLTHLYLSSNQLASLPKEIVQLQNLTQLDLSRNQLASLPPEIGQLQHLTQLDLSYNQLASLPPEIGQLQHLTQLSLSGNGLASLPPEIGHLQHLTQLYLSRNQLASLPPEIGQLQHLTHLYLSSNQLASLPPEIGHLQHLTQLDLSSNQLASLPKEIGQLQHLTSLDLSGNQLASLPPEIVQLQHLTQLSLSDNQLASLPPEIGHLQHLTQLYLSRNQLASLPPEIGQLQHLTHLYLSSNPLASLPPEIGQLQHLTQLDLSYNQLASLPPEIGQLQHLTQLDLSYNQLASLPPEIGQLQHLTQLDLSYNQLASLPKEIAELRNVKQIKLRGNPLEIAIPSKWLDKEEAWEYSQYAQDILAYYKQMHEEGGRPLGEARVLVVGEADGGKTKLLRALLYGEYGEKFTDKRDPTDGIEVNTLEAEGVRLRLWDFGGQEIMHATHRFFLSRRCVYVLVADATRDSNYNEEKIEYWLELLKFFGGDAPVLLVASKVESFSLNVNERGLQEKYPNLVRMPALRTSSKTGKGIEELRHAIFEQVRLLPSVNVMLPRTFLAVKDALEEMKSDQKLKVIEDAKYRHLCEENGITEEERQNTLLQLLHDMGVVLHYEDDRLSDFGILNPDWATGGVYKVVNSPQIKESHGKFTLAQLKTILADEEMYPASMRRRIVDLMKKFELTYELPLEQDMFILPSALQVNQPELSGWDDPTMTFEYRYPVLQASVLHRFMVAVHDLILDNQVWYSGVVITRGENMALVKADTRAKRVTIKVKGAEESRKEFLYFIRLQFERIHGEEVKPEGYVYPPHCPKLSLEYEKIKKFLKAGTTTLDEIYEEKPVKINLRELLDGFITPEERRKDEEKEKLEAKQKGLDKEDKGGDTYITNNITMGNMEGSNLVLGEGHRVTQSVQNSFNTFPVEVQNALAELMKLTEALLSKIEESEQKEELKDELARLQHEAVAAKTKGKIVKPIVERLAEAAKNLNEIGKPVLELAMTVIQLINTLPG